MQGYLRWTVVAAEEHRRLLSLLRGLRSADWAVPTDCTGWDVRAVAVHQLANLEAAGNPAEQLRQLRRGDRHRRAHPELDRLDALNAAVQERFAALAPGQVLDRLAVAGPRSVRARRLLWPVQRAPVPFGPPFGTVPLSYLLLRILTRDAWMHRVDVCRATGRAPLLDGHDAAVVADVAQDWAERHGRPVRLELTGSAGGSHGFGPPSADKPVITVDAVDFARTVAGRSPGTGLLAVRVPF